MLCAAPPANCAPGVLPFRSANHTVFLAPHASRESRYPSRRQTPGRRCCVDANLSVDTLYRIMERLGKLRARFRQLTCSSDLLDLVAGPQHHSPDSEMETLYSLD